jgi:O-antigen ligase
MTSATCPAASHVASAWQRPSSIRAVQWRVASPAIPQALAAAISLGYLALHINGPVGPLAMLCALVLACAGRSSETLACAAFLLAPHVLGVSVEAVGLPIPGTVIAVAIAASILLSWPAPRLRAMFRVQRPAAAWLAAVVSVLALAYVLGPRNDYAVGKLVGFAVGTGLKTAGLFTLIRGRRVALMDLGIIAAVACVYYLSVLFYVTPALRPVGILTSGGLRLADTALTHGGVVSAGGRSVALLAGWSLVMLAGSAAACKRARIGFARGCLLLAIAVAPILALNSSGQRAALAAVAAAALALACSKTGRNRWTVAIAGCSVLLVAAIVAHAAASNSPLLSQVLNDRHSFSERLNRSANWTAAVYRIDERPLLGHGLGGYYIDYAGPMRGDVAGRYPHNLFLELLVETGLLGTVVIAGPPLLAALRARPSFLTWSRESLLPLVVYCFVLANVTEDLRSTSTLFAMCAAFWPAARVARPRHPVRPFARPCTRAA